jgi:DNA-directed RNA polymerase sigma subunit (sigma70/sigma32)
MNTIALDNTCIIESFGTILSSLSEREKNVIERRVGLK